MSAPSNEKKFGISVIPGDGIGNEVVPEGLRVLEAVGKKYGFDYGFEHYDWNCERYAKTGAMMPEDGLASIKDHDSILLGAVGFPGGEGIMRSDDCRVPVVSRCIGPSSKGIPPGGNASI